MKNKTKKPSRRSSEPKQRSASRASARKPERILVIDIGGSKVKLLATGHVEPHSFRSGPTLSPAEMVKKVMKISKGWRYDAISIGIPGPVGPNGPRSEPGNLGNGWVGFDFSAAFGHPVRIVNDAAMQALGSYEGGRMLFLGLGTGLGSTLIVDNIIVPLELGELWWRDPKMKDVKILSEALGKKGLKKIGKERWSEIMEAAVGSLRASFLVDDVVIGGGNVSKLRSLPTGCRLGHNLTAFRGGVRLWHLADVSPQWASAADSGPSATPSEWRLL